MAFARNYTKSNHTISRTKRQGIFIESMLYLCHFMGVAIYFISARPSVKKTARKLVSSRLINRWTSGDEIGASPRSGVK